MTLVGAGAQQCPAGPRETILGQGMNCSSIFVMVPF
jgi:hypothetical protein